jgi:hypothetical protein
LVHRPDSLPVAGSVSLLLAARHDQGFRDGVPDIPNSAILYVATFAQAADAPRFEGADVHASAPSTNIRDNFVQGPFAGGGRFEIRKATILDLIRLGWTVQPDKIDGGPNWAGLDRFDILAKAPRTPARLTCG